jgi:hypothetical protein
MPLPEIPLLEESDTFQDLFTSTNTSIDRLNLLEIANIFAGGGITYTGPNSVGGITLSVDLSSSVFLNNDNEIGFKVFNSVPSGLTIGSPIGITGATFGSVSNLSLDSSRKYLGIITELYSDGYRITTSGRKITGTYFADNTLYYLANGGVTSTIPTSNGQVIKPVLFSIGLTYGFIVLNQKETLISESTSYIKSASRTIAEIPTNSGFSAGNVVFYNITGSTWAKSSAAADNTSEVFGVIESTTGLTATVVTQGSVNIPNTMLHDMGSNGGSGGNDIWFLSGTTSGHMQNLAPTTVGNIIKPVYYAYPHEFNGATFSGLVVNYIGYSVSSATSSTTTSTTAVGSIFASPILVTGNTVTSVGKSVSTNLANFYINHQLIYDSNQISNINRSDLEVAFYAINAQMLAYNPNGDEADTVVSITDPKYTTLVNGLGLKSTAVGLYERNLGYLHYIPLTNLSGYNFTKVGSVILKQGVAICFVLFVDTTRVLLYIVKDIGTIFANTDLTIVTDGGTPFPFTLGTSINRTTAVGFRLPNYSGISEVNVDDGTGTLVKTILPNKSSAPLWHMKLE